VFEHRVCARLVQIKVPTRRFPAVFDRAVRDPSINVKLARVDVTEPDVIRQYLFRTTSPTQQATVSSLAEAPNEMGVPSRLLYKWVVPVPLFQRLRTWFEEYTQQPADWSEAADRNSLMYESAQPLAQLYNPIIKHDATFVLQEFFVPRHAFHAWQEAMQEVLWGRGVSPAGVSLLNLTVRFVNHDSVTALPYATHPDGSYAFVLYYRLPRTTAADEELAALHTSLARKAMELGGRFYLPYRHHYTDAEVLACYPELPAFFEAKRRVDPTNVFGNAWFHRYAAPFLDPLPPALAGDGTGAHTHPSAGSEQALQHREEGGARHDDLPGAVRDGSAVPGGAPNDLTAVATRRTDSYRRTFGDPDLRARFMLFLRHVFHIESPRSLYMASAKATWDADEDATDAEVYTALVRSLKARSWASAHALRNHTRFLWQLRAQRRELTAQTVNILQQLGVRPSQITSYASVGDGGRLVRSLAKELRAADDEGVWRTGTAWRRPLGGGGAGPFPGRAWVVHDRPRGLTDVIERGSVLPVGDFVPLDYDRVDEACLRAIPTGAVDLVTCNQGLHHFHPAQLPHFLREVARVLRPGGVFITREHDATDGLLPLLDLAHSTFNAVMGVGAESEAAEVRGFRPLREWRRLVEGCTGLEDTMVYAAEPLHLDPTEDVMMAFRKPRPPAGHRRSSSGTVTAADDEYEDERLLRLQGAARDACAALGLVPPVTDRTSTYWRLPEWFLVETAAAYGNFLSHTPWYAFPYMRYLGLYWRLLYLEGKAVAETHGGPAVLGGGLVMGGVIGGVMSLMFMQLQLLALPTRLGLLLSGAASSRTTHALDASHYPLDAPHPPGSPAGLQVGGRSGRGSEFDHVLVTLAPTEGAAPPPPIDWCSIDDRLQAIPVPHAAAVTAGTGVGATSNANDTTSFGQSWVLVVPRHLPFTAVLTRLAADDTLRANAARVVDVSGCSSRLQVELRAVDAHAKQALEKALLDIPPQDGVLGNACRGIGSSSSSTVLFDYGLPPSHVNVVGSGDGDLESGSGLYKQAMVVGVELPALLEVLRVAESMPGVHVKQVYDFL